MHYVNELTHDDLQRIERIEGEAGDHLIVVGYIELLSPIIPRTLWYALEQIHERVIASQDRMHGREPNYSCLI